jgi:hypothetical protein
MGKERIRGSNMITTTDVDIDVSDRTEILNLINNIPAMMMEENKKKKHNTGVYFHEVPIDPFTGYCTLDYKKAEEIGFFKLDVLNVSIYDGLTPNEVDEFVSKEPMWELLEHEEIVKQCFHIHNHFEIVSKLKPTSIEELAAVLAIIRPAKRYLLNQSWDNIFNEVWTKPTDGGYFFKKAHAIAYATAIVVQLNKIVKDFSS